MRPHKISLTNAHQRRFVHRNTSSELHACLLLQIADTITISFVWVI